MGDDADRDLAHHMRLSRTEGVGPVTYRRLIAEFGDAQTALRELPTKARRAGRVADLRIATLDDMVREIDATRDLGGQILRIGDPLYPRLLALVADAPPIISVLGHPARLSDATIAVIGARNASAAGMRFAESLSVELAAAGMSVVSGLARGIDAAAHRGALSVGRTIAAVAGGLDQVYPPEHASLQADIAINGAVITEAPLGTTPQARHFPRRNRLIAGLALGCVVVEAALRSGTLITADLVEKYGRRLFSVPGSPLDPRARGCNNLIRQGAYLTENVTDILGNMPKNPLFPQGNQGFCEPVAVWGNGGETGDPQGAACRAQVLALLSFAPTPVDDLVRHCQFSISAVLASLSELELAGLCELLPGGLAILVS